MSFPATIVQSSSNSDTTFQSLALNDGFKFGGDLYRKNSTTTAININTVLSNAGDISTALEPLDGTVVVRKLTAVTISYITV